jgi:hypothetical protein
MLSTKLVEFFSVCPCFHVVPSFFSARRKSRGRRKLCSPPVRVRDANLRNSLTLQLNTASNHDHPHGRCPFGPSWSPLL